MQATFPAAQTLHFANLLRWCDYVQHLAGPTAVAVFSKTLSVAKPFFYEPVLPPTVKAAPDVPKVRPCQNCHTPTTVRLNQSLSDHDAFTGGRTCQVWPKRGGRNVETGNFCKTRCFQTCSSAGCSRKCGSREEGQCGTSRECEEVWR